MIEHCYCGQIKPHAHTPECEKPRVRLNTSDGTSGVMDSRCGYLALPGMICNKCGREHDGGSQTNGGPEQ